MGQVHARNWASRHDTTGIFDTAHHGTTMQVPLPCRIETQVSHNALETIRGQVLCLTDSRFPADINRLTQESSCLKSLQMPTAETQKRKQHASKNREYQILKYLVLQMYFQKGMGGTVETRWASLRMLRKSWIAVCYIGIQTSFGFSNTPSYSRQWYHPIEMRSKTYMSSFGMDKPQDG